MAEIDDARLAQLVGVRSSKTGYYARWRGTATDLERALAQGSAQATLGVLRGSEARDVEVSFP